MEEPHILKESIIVMKEQLGITFEMMADKLGVKPVLLASVTGMEYKETTSDIYDDVVVPFNF